MHNFDGIIFDVDGTLTSTNDLIFESFRFVSKKYLNKSLTNDEIVELFGPTENVILKEWGGENYHAIKNDYYDFYTNNHHMASLYPGIKDVLNFIRSSKVPLSIFTGKGREAAAITLKKLDVYEYFDLIITGDDVIEHKPSAEGINKFLEKFDLAKEKVLMIGDSPSDIKAARSAGVKIASVVWDSYVNKEVLQLGSDYIFYEVNELKDFLENNI